MNSLAIYSSGTFHMNQQRVEPMCNSSVSIQDVVWKTSRERWTIETGDERVSGKSVLVAQHDDDDDDIMSHVSLSAETSL